MKRNKMIYQLSTLLVCMAMFFAFASSSYAGLNEREIFVGTGARPLGMGSAFAAVPAESGSVFWNPSTLALLPVSQISLMSSPFASKQEEREDAVSLAFGLKQLGVSKRNCGALGFSSWLDGWGDELEQNRIFVAGYGIPLGKGFAAGANLRHHRRNLNSKSAVGWSVDFGLLFSRKLNWLGERITVGASVEDIAGRIWWNNSQKEETFSMIGRFGSAYHPDKNTLLSFDLVLRDDENLNNPVAETPMGTGSGAVVQNKLRAHIGVERWFFNLLGVRFGYTGVTNYNRFPEGEWARGISLRTKDGGIDYAYVSGKELSKGVHWISATLRWGGIEREKTQTVKTDEIAPAVPEIPSPSIVQSIPPVAIPKKILNPLSVSAKTFSPNSDGIKDVTAFNIDVEGKWNLEIRDEHGEMVKNYSGTGIPFGGVKWYGRHNDGYVANDGIYTVQLIGGTAEDNPLAKLNVTVDTTPPDVSVSAEPMVLVSRVNQAQRREQIVMEVAKLHVRTADKSAIARWQLSVVDDKNQSVGNLSGESGLPQTILWNDWQKNVDVSQLKGEYFCTLTVEDIAGNQSKKDASVSVVDLGGKLAGRREQRGIALTLPGIAFESNQYNVNPECYDVVQEVANAISAYPDARILIEGHTDDVGSESYNMNLSSARANAVLTHLVETFQIDPRRLSATGYGESRPIADNTTEEGRQKNRRVEIILLTAEGKAETEYQGVKSLVNRPVGSPFGSPLRSEQNLHSRSPIEDLETDIPLIPEEEEETPKFTVRAASFKEQENSETFTESLKSLNLGHEIRILEVTLDTGIWYRVTIGAFSYEDDAKTLAKLLEEHEGIQAIVTSY